MARARRSLASARLIAAKDVRQGIRDRSALLLSIVAPFGLAVILSQLVGPAAAFHASYAVVDLDGGRLGSAFRDEVLSPLESAGVADLIEVPTEAAARDAVGAGVDAAIIVPQGFTQAIEAGRPTSLEIIGAQDRALAVEVARAAAQRFGDQVSTVQLSLAAVGRLDGSPPDAAGVASITAAASGTPAVTLTDSVAGLRQLDLTTFFSAAMAAMFLFFAAQVGMVSVFEERRQRTLDRILAAPIEPWAVLAGKIGGAFVTSTLALSALVVATSVLMGADWGPPLGVAALCVALIVAALGVSALVTSFATNASVANAAGSSVAITLAILGGTFSPAAQGPAFLSTLALLTPHGWFLRGLGDLHGPGATPVDVLPAVLVLLAMGLATGSAGMLRARRLVSSR